MKLLNIALLWTVVAQAPACGGGTSVSDVQQETPDASASTSEGVFVFDAQAGALDHALATASLVPQVIESIEWHINADEPQLLDYNLKNGRDADLFDASSPYRASDHDPVIIGLDLTN
jgi:predicted extracellular nuclease